MIEIGGTEDRACCFAPAFDRNWQQV